MSAAVLFLDHDYRPLRVENWQSAICDLFVGKVEVIEYSRDRMIQGVDRTYPMPSVVRVLRRFRRDRIRIRFSRVNIYARDGYRCQYCALKCTIDELTYDHVIPRSKGGKTTWENIVSACYACNRRKANRTPLEAGMKLLTTPAQAGMKLLTTPARPTWMPSVQIRVSARSVPDAWRDYVYWTGEIDNEEGGVD